MNLQDFTEEDLDNDLNLSESGLFVSSRLKSKDYFSFKFNPDIAWSIVDHYIDEYEVDELKGYLLFLFMMVEHDKRSGPFKRVAMYFSKETRKSYYDYRSEVLRIIEHGEKFITKAQRGNKYSVSEVYDKTQNKLTINTEVNINSGVGGFVIDLGKSMISMLWQFTKWATY